MNEVTYSWSSFLQIFDMILHKIVRDLNSNMFLQKNKFDSHASSSFQSLNSSKEKTI